MLMGLGDLVGRGGAANHEGDAWVGGGGNVWAHGGAGEEENIQSTEDDQPQQGLAANEGGRVEQDQQGPGVNAGGGGGDAEHVRSLQDLRAPSFLGSLWDLVGSLG